MSKFATVEERFTSINLEYGEKSYENYREINEHFGNILKNVQRKRRSGRKVEKSI